MKIPSGLSHSGENPPIFLLESSSNRRRFRTRRAVKFPNSLDKSLLHQNSDIFLTFAIIIVIKNGECIWKTFAGLRSTRSTFCRTSWASGSQLKSISFSMIAKIGNMQSVEWTKVARRRSFCCTTTVNLYRERWADRHGINSWCIWAQLALRNYDSSKHSEHESLSRFRRFNSPLLCVFRSRISANRPIVICCDFLSRAAGQCNAKETRNKTGASGN